MRSRFTSVRLHSHFASECLVLCSSRFSFVLRLELGFAVLSKDTPYHPRSEVGHCPNRDMHLGHLQRRGRSVEHAIRTRKNARNISTQTAAEK